MLKKKKKHLLDNREMGKIYREELHKKKIYKWQAYEEVLKIISYQININSNKIPTCRAIIKRPDNTGFWQRCEPSKTLISCLWVCNLIKTTLENCLAYQ